MNILLIIFFLIFIVAVYKIAVRKISKLSTTKTKNNGRYFGYYVILWAFIPSLLMFLLAYIYANQNIKSYILEHKLVTTNILLKDSAYEQVLNIAKELRNGVVDTSIKTNTILPKTELIAIAKGYIIYNSKVIIGVSIAVFLIAALIALGLIQMSNLNINFQKKIEIFIKNVLLLFAVIAVITTLGIMASLLFEAIKFFQEISVFKFIFGTKWAPEEAELDPQNSFGILPLLSGTLLISLIAIITAIIIGVSAAIYMAEYMSHKWRRIIKPMLEILAGIPSIVYGFFAAIYFSPFVLKVFAQLNIEVESENALSAGIIIGIMIIPFISSITDDVLRSIPKSIREGAMGMGSMRNEMIRKILIPAALPGIVGGILLSISRAIGETMIVVMASSLAANLTLNPLEPVTTITTQIVLLVQGDQSFNNPKTLAAFALGFVLLILTLFLNMIAIKIVNKYKAQYD
ncbi:Phosphate transport system permease protein PstC [Candidatus Hepatincolaceae symbiont of Richtersius coronifer]